MKKKNVVFFLSFNAGSDRMAKKKMVKFKMFHRKGPSQGGKKAKGENNNVNNGPYKKESNPVESTHSLP